MRTQKTQKNGFTLIELLVVIAIIAILAAILFPVFAKARESAKRTACLNNMKQLSTAFLGYFQDNDDKFPPYIGVGIWGTPVASQMGWSERIYPYVKSLDVYRCPSNGKSNFSYSMNAASAIDLAGTATFTANLTTRVKSPTKFMHLVECPGAGNVANPIVIGRLNTNGGDTDLSTEFGGSNQQDGVVFTNASGDPGPMPVASPWPIAKVRDTPGKHIGQLHFPGWHNNGNNIMFLDGHVAYFTTWKPDSMTFDWRKQ